MIIGITGSSGSGKTYLSKLLQNEYNTELINADEVVKEMSMPGQIYYKEIIKAFGKDILLESGEINKSKLARTIFEDSKKRDAINTLTFKYIVEEIKARVSSSTNEIVIVDAPLLIESKLNEICDIVISVIAEEEIKLQRICKRDNIDKTVATSRLKAQPNNDFYIKNSNLVIINNNCNLTEILEDIKEIIKSKMINNETVIIQEGKTRILQFKKLLEYDKLSHAFTLKPLDFGSNDTYCKIKEKADNDYNIVCKLLDLDSRNLVRPYQTHTNNIKMIDNETGIFPKELTDVDGLVTNKKNKILSLTFADCTPIYLYDKEKNIIGDIHSGWQGTVKKIAKAAIQFMKQEFNSNPEEIICVIGPTIRKCHFEVKQDVRDIFYDTFCYMNNIEDIIEYNTKTDSYFIDTVTINKNLLLEEGILEKNIIDCGICTVCNSNIIHSYRKEGANSGRNTALICLKE